MEQSRGTEDRLTILARMARELRAGLDLEGTLRRSLALTLRAVGATAGSLFLVDERGRLTLAGMIEEDRYRAVDLEVARAVLQNGLVGWVMRQQEALLVNDLDGDPRWQATPLLCFKLRPGSAISAPLMLPNRVVGVVTCAHPQKGHFVQGDLDTLQFIADQVAVAVENARLFSAEEQRRTFANTLSEAARTLTATLDLDEVLNLILEMLSRVIPYDSASIFLMQDRRLVMRAMRGFENADELRGLSFDLVGNSFMARMIAEREPLVFEDVQTEPGWINVPGVWPIHGWIAAPLVARGEVVGALTVDSRRVGAYNEADARMVAAFADHVAIAIANARLWQQTQRQLEQLGFLYLTGQTVTASLELEQVLMSLMDRVRDYFEVEAASVALVEEETNEVVFCAASGAAAEEIIGVRLQLGQGIAGWIAQTGKPLLIFSVRNDPRFYSGVDESTGFRTRTMLAAPIKLGDETIGVIEAINSPPGRPAPDELELLLNVATLAASAIQNARHFHRALEAERRYAALFENSADPIAITDENGLIVDTNRQFCQMLGWDKAHLLGSEIFALFQDPGAVRAYLPGILAGQNVSFDARASTRDGAFIPFEVRASHILHGDRPSIQWICHDLSERIRLEQTREDLTRMIIHDLRNPLSSIMSSLELISTVVHEETPPIPLDQLFAVARRSGEKLNLLIDSILGLARLQSGRAELARRPIDVLDMVREAVEQMRPAAASRELSLESCLPETLPVLIGDRDVLQRVLLNLLENALKFTPAGGSVRVGVSQPDPDSLLFAVADTGPGIAPEYHEHIFDQFARVYYAEAKGTGIGLAFCRLAVEAHGGRIWVESALGEGATFKFVLPLNGKGGAA